MIHVGAAATVDAGGLERTARVLASALRVGMTRAVANGTREAVETVRSNQPWKDQSGWMTRSAFHGTTSIGPRMVVGEFGWRAKYASYLDQGTRPHIIRPGFHALDGGVRVGNQRRTRIGPHRVRFLRWYDGDGGVHFAPFVRHPGTKAMRFVEKAEHAFVRRARYELRNALGYSGQSRIATTVSVGGSS